MTLLVVLCLWLLTAGTVRAATSPPDVRVLIDVSGSMKKTDPGNLRVPALKLLAALLPGGAHAGVWLFDTDVTPLLPPASVDDVWKQTARERARAPRASIREGATRTSRPRWSRRARTGRPASPATGADVTSSC